MGNAALQVVWLHLIPWWIECEQYCLFFCYIFCSTWCTASEWHCHSHARHSQPMSHRMLVISFSSQQCHHISSHYQQDVSDSAWFPSPTSQHITWQQEVSDNTLIFCPVVLLHLITYQQEVSGGAFLLSAWHSHFMTTGSEWQCPFLYPALHPIPWPIVCELPYPMFAQHSYPIPWPTVCEWWCFSLCNSLITSHPMTNSVCMTVSFVLLSSLISSYR